jgi:hypothetical protein
MLKASEPESAPLKMTQQLVKGISLVLIEIGGVPIEHLPISDENFSELRKSGLFCLHVTGLKPKSFFLHISEAFPSCSINTSTSSQCGAKP